MNIFKDRFILVCRIILAAVFVYAAIPKLIDPGEFARAILGYKIIHPSLVFLVSYIIPPLELIIGVMVLIGPFKREAALWIMLLMCFFMAASSLVLIRGMDTECGCFGRGSWTIGWATMLRDTALILLSFTIYHHYNRTAKKKTFSD